MFQLKTTPFGSLGPFQPVAPDLYASASGRFHVLGSGEIGGKGLGLAALDQAQQLLEGFDTPRTLVVSDTWWGLDNQSVEAPSGIDTFNPNKVTPLLNTIRDLGLASSPLAIRSSSLIEDLPGHPAAGLFHSDFHGISLDSIESQRVFLNKLLSVLNSAYTPKARKHWAQQGYTSIPPLPVIIQEVAAAPQDANAQYVMPLIAGISNGSLQQAVRIKAVIGLGIAAVEEQNKGVSYSFPVLKEKHGVSPRGYTVEGSHNTNEFWVIDRVSGEAVKTNSEALPEFKAQVSVGLSHSIQTAHSIATLHKGLELLLKHPLDLEWSVPDAQHITMLQARPILPRNLVIRPKINPAQTLLESANVLGYGDHVYQQALLVSIAPSRFARGQFEKIIQKFPNTFIIYVTKVAQMFTSNELEEYFLPSTDSIVVVDLNSDSHFVHPLSHFSLNCEESGQLVIYTDELMHDKLIRHSLDPIDLFPHSYSTSNRVLLYRFKQPLRVSGDSGANWSVISVDPEESMP